MAWLFGDSFDHYTDLTTKYSLVGTSGQAISVGTGRYGTNNVRFTNGNGLVNRGLTTGSTAGAFASMAAQANVTANINFAQLWCGPNNCGHVIFTRNTDGGISAWQQPVAAAPLQNYGGVLLGSTVANAWPGGHYVSVELFVKVHATAGIVKIRVNGALLLSLTGVNTANGADPSVSWTSWYVGLGSSVGTLDVDDLLFYDDSAGDVTDFVGDLTGECVIVNGAGSSAQWTKNSGATNASCVDENPPDGDTTYVEDSTVGHLDLYTKPALARVQDGIRCVQVVTTSKKSGAGTRALAGVVRSGGSNYVGADQYLGTEYAVGIAARTKDPATSAAWSASGVNAAEVGPQVTV